MRKPLHTLSDAELEKETKRRKTFFFIYAALILMMGAVSLNNFTRGTGGVTDYIPFVFLPICIMMYANYKRAVNELQARRKK